MKCIAEILVGRNEFRRDIFEKFPPIAKRTAFAFIKAHNLYWISLQDQ
jgi:hypothetical protein